MRNHELLGVFKVGFDLGLDAVDIIDIEDHFVAFSTELAELCASVQAWRAGSTMLRSVLEKVLTQNGYTEKRLVDKIDAANKDGIITDSRTQKAHNEIRVLGNDILHDEWKEVSEEDFSVAYHYCQRIIEDFYDDRDTIENILKVKGRTS